MEDDQRFEYYDELLVVEVRVQKKGVGLYFKKEVLIYRVVDVFGVSGFVLKKYEILEIKVKVVIKN